MNAPILSPEEIHRFIHLIRGQRVMAASDLARFYGVTTFNLNKAVARNRNRFPEDFAFQLTLPETRLLIFQVGISKTARGGNRKAAWVFTEQGVAMLASVLRSDRAATVSVALIRAFVKLRQFLASHVELATKLQELEKRLEGHDAAIANLFEAIRQLLNAEPASEHREIGFHAGQEAKR